MERFSYKSGCAMRFAKHLKKTGLQCYCKNFGLKQPYTVTTTLKSVITKAQEYEVGYVLLVHKQPSCSSVITSALFT